MLKFVIAISAGLMLMSGPAMAQPLTILALGDSLTAGYGLAPGEAFPVKLEAALKAKGHDVTIINAGVSGDTAADGAARLDWALTGEVKAAIVELGANDMLRGLPPAQAEQALDRILGGLAEKKIPVLIAGMRAPANMGPDYQKQFDGMYQRLADKYGALLYPFYLDGVAAQRDLNQADGLHPNARGVDVIVSRIIPAVEQLISKTGEK